MTRQGQPDRTSVYDGVPLSYGSRGWNRTAHRLAGQVADLGYWARLLGQARDMAIADHQQYLQLTARLDRFCTGGLKGKRLLEVGCGWHSGLTLLLHSSGVQVTGIDIAGVGPKQTLLSPALWRANGPSKMLRRSAGRILIDRAYYRNLRASLGAPLVFDRLDIRQMNACAMTFMDGSFDFVYSNAVFEHIADVPSAAAEVARVLKSGGVALISIHLFPSISGGHSLDWVDPDVIRRRHVPPWDHLRSNLYPHRVSLNRLRERDYLKAFSGHLDIVDVASRFEGECHLTSAIEKECAEYSREELLKTNLTLVARKN